MDLGRKPAQIRMVIIEEDAVGIQGDDWFHRRIMLYRLLQRDRKANAFKQLQQHLGILQESRSNLSMGLMLNYVGAQSNPKRINLHDKDDHPALSCMLVWLGGNGILYRVHLPVAQPPKQHRHHEGADEQSEHA